MGLASDGFWKERCSVFCNKWSEKTVPTESIPSTEQTIELLELLRAYAGQPALIAHDLYLVAILNHIEEN